MLRKIDWESRIGRRLRLRDLHVFSTVVQRGSMAKAAQHLGVSQPAVSEVIADLEHALGVRLLDRSAQGIEPTVYGGALLKRSVAVFDELKQSIRDIEFLSDATTGEVRIGFMEAPLSRSCLLLTAHRQPTFSGNIELIQRKRVLVDGIDVLVVFSKLLTTYHPLGSEGINASCCIRGCPSDTRRAAF